MRTIIVNYAGREKEREPNCIGTRVRDFFDRQSDTMMSSTNYMHGTSRPRPIIYIVTTQTCNRNPIVKPYEGI